jgi:hypothetical protein
LGRHLGGSGHGDSAGLGLQLVLLGDLRGGVHGLVLGLGHGADNLVHLGGTLLVVFAGRSFSLSGGLGNLSVGRRRTTSTEALGDGRLNRGGGSLVAGRTLLVAGRTLLVAVRTLLVVRP